MKHKYLLFLSIIIGLLVSCTGNVEDPRVQAVSIARRGTSLGESAPLITLNPTQEGQVGGLTLTAANEPEDAISPDVSSVAEESCSAEFDPGFESGVLDLLNGARIEANSPRVVEQSQLTLIASQHSLSMACDQYFGHRNLAGLSVELRVEQAGYEYVALGEIIAAGYSSPREVVDAWLASQPHQEVILDQSFSEVGIGYVFVPGSENGHYWTIVFGHP